MNTKTRIVLLAAAGLVSGALMAGEETGGPGAAPEARKEVHKKIIVTAHHGGEHPRLEEATFLGVLAQPVSPALGAQLGLAKGMGLVLEKIVEGSPAVGILQENDVLQKFEDQMLIDARQLAVLIRSHKAGDEVSLGVIRAAKPLVLKVKLGSRAMPGLDAPPFDISAPMHARAYSLGRNEVDRMLQGMKGAPHAQVRIVRREGGKPERDMLIPGGMRVVVMEDDTCNLRISGSDGTRTLIIQDKSGKELFNGPINTPEEISQVPEPYRKKLDTLEDGKEFEWKTDEKFQAPMPPPPPPPPTTGGPRDSRPGPLEGGGLRAL